MHLAAPLGWYADPFGRHEQRFFDGRFWTPHVADGQVLSRESSDLWFQIPPQTEAVSQATTWHLAPLLVVAVATVIVLLVALLWA